MHKPKNDILEYVENLKSDRIEARRLLQKLFSKHTAKRISHTTTWFDTQGDPFLVDVAEALVKWKLLDPQQVMWK